MNRFSHIPLSYTPYHMKSRPRPQLVSLCFHDSVLNLDNSDCNYQFFHDSNLLSDVFKCRPMFPNKHLPKFPLIEAFHCIWLIILLGIQCQFDLAKASFPQFFHYYVLIDLLFSISLSGCRYL
jgi:hypothetical protein